MKNNIGMEVRANGKVNLFLDVLSLTANGFHEIKSIMQSVSLCDRLIVSASRGSINHVSISCDVPYIPCDERNIAYRAAMAYLEKSGIRADVEISIYKRIPVSGGMAGGSTDAAAVLKALNKLLGGAVPNDELYTIAASLGSDIPFCMSGKTMLCEGRGEILTPLENRAKLLFLIVPSSESVSTPWAYGELDKRYGDFGGRSNEERYSALCTALASGDATGVCKNMYNIFEDVILPERPLAAKAKSLLLESGAMGAMMSGSGPTVFGIFKDEETRSAAMQTLKNSGYHPKAAESMV